MNEGTVGAIPVERGCGTRIAGGIYWELGMGPGGKPPQDFVVDPVVLLPDGLVVPARGVFPIQQKGIWHLLSHIGSENYPNPADYYEEYKRFGVSWRLPSNLPFDLLTPGQSRLLLTHSRGWVDNVLDYDPWYCLKGIPEHHPDQIDRANPPVCAGFWFQDLSAPADALANLDDPRFVYRQMPSFAYWARRTPDGIAAGHHREGVCFSFGCTRLVVVKGNEHDKPDGSLAKARKSGYKVDEVDE